MLISELAHLWVTQCSGEGAIEGLAGEMSDQIDVIGCLLGRRRKLRLCIPQSSMGRLFDLVGIGRMVTEQSRRTR